MTFIKKRVKSVCSVIEAVSYKARSDTGELWAVFFTKWTHIWEWQDGSDFVAPRYNGGISFSGNHSPIQMFANFANLQISNRERWCLLKMAWPKQETMNWRAGSGRDKNRTLTNQKNKECYTIQHSKRGVLTVKRIAGIWRLKRGACKWGFVRIHKILADHDTSIWHLFCLLMVQLRCFVIAGISMQFPCIGQGVHGKIIGISGTSLELQPKNGWVRCGWLRQITITITIIIIIIIIMMIIPSPPP